MYKITMLMTCVVVYEYMRCWVICYACVVKSKCWWVL